MRPDDEIATQRLVLVPVTPAAAEAVVAGDLSRISAGEGWPHADSLDGLRMAVDGDAACWFVTRDGIVIGDCGTHGRPDANGDVEIGFGLAEPYRGLGYGSELVAALSRWLLGRPGVRRVVAREVLADNVPSRGALERAGFVLERADAGRVWYALTPLEPSRPQRAAK